MQPKNKYHGLEFKAQIDIAMIENAAREMKDAADKLSAAFKRTAEAIIEAFESLRQLDQKTIIIEDVLIILN